MNSSSDAQLESDLQNSLVALHISPPAQELYLLNNNYLIQTFKISTAANGVGERKNSYCTPRGLHYVRAKIGAGLPINTVFSSRRSIGEIYTPELSLQHPNRDWILSRILWLSGLEPGFNRLGEFDSMQRYIYIHGTPDEELLGKPVSHGCIRMRNSEIVELFDQIPVGSKVYIEK